jgi:hypothetical protein
MTLADHSDEYAAFVDKFKPKKTTDDCYTPPAIYEVILGYVVKRYGINREQVKRPFYPGADYERDEYPEGCCVVDNPPFSILSQIIDFYQTNGIRFFLFAPTMTCLSGRKHLMDTNHIICHSAITYENGAVVNTSFITNLETDGTIVESCPELANAITDKDKELQKAEKRSLPKYEYPDNVLTAAKVNWFCAHHTPYKLNRRDCIPIQKLDAMNGKTIFGGGLLLNERAAAERAAAERAAAERAAAERAAAIKWPLSERELRMVEMITSKEDQ